MKQEVIQKAPEQVKKPTPNMTGIPTQMKLDFERRSGLSFDDVRVHYNSDKPARIGALAYTQGNQVHVGPGQEKHLRHELGHVVQQKQGIVRPTTWINGLPVNNSPLLERSASQSMLSSLSLIKSNGITDTCNAVQMIASLPPKTEDRLFDREGKFVDIEPRYLIKRIHVEGEVPTPKEDYTDGTPTGKASSDSEKSGERTDITPNVEKQNTQSAPESANPHEYELPTSEKQKAHSDSELVKTHKDLTTDTMALTEKASDSDDSEKSQESSSLQPIGTDTMEKPDDAQTVALHCEKLGIGSPTTAESLDYSGNAEQIFKEIEDLFYYQFQWIKKYYEAIKGNLPDVAPNSQPQQLKPENQRTKQVLELQRAAIVSSSNLGEDAYTFFKSNALAERPVSQSYFSDQIKDGLMLSLNKARIYTGLIQELAMHMIEPSKNHDDSPAVQVEITLPVTTLTSQWFRPCIATIKISDHSFITCLNSTTFLERNSESGITHDDFMKLLQFERKVKGKPPTSIKIGLLPKYISPAIGESLRKLTVEDLYKYTETAGAGTHAEVRAVNKFLKQHETDVRSGSKIACDLRIARCLPRVPLTIKDNGQIELSQFAKCPHCKTILTALDSIIQWTITGAEDGTKDIAAEITESSSTTTSNGGPESEGRESKTLKIKSPTPTPSTEESAKKSIRKAAEELGFKIVDKRESLEPVNDSDDHPASTNGGRGDPMQDRSGSAQDRGGSAQESERPRTQESERFRTQGSKRPRVQESERPRTQESERFRTQGSKRPRVQESERFRTQESERFRTQGSKRPHTQGSKRPRTRM